MTLVLADPALLRDALYVGGKWQQPQQCISLDAVNPATGEVLASASRGRRDDAAAAIDAEMNLRRRGQEQL